MRRALALTLLVLAGCADRGRERAAAPVPVVAPLVAPAPAVPGPTLALGVGHTCALDGGRVHCWGYGAHGQLGLGDRYDRPTPALVPAITDALAVTAGVWHTCALRPDGEVLCWGDGALGQLGDGIGGTRPHPAPVPDLRALAVVAGATHTCAIDHGRKVLCWGSNFRGESGPGDDHHVRPTPLPGSPTADALAAGDGFTCALAGGTVTCWGADPVRDGKTTEPAPVPGLADVVAIAAGGHHLCALAGAGTLTCFGTGSKGQLGDGRPPALARPSSPHGIATPLPRTAVVAGIDDAVQIALGDEFACARRRPGALWCWGSDRDGQLGDGDPSPAGTREPVAGASIRDRPAPALDLADVVEVAAGSAHACARLAGGELRCWGYNEFGQAGPFAARASDPPITHPLPPGVRLTVGGAHACAFTDRDVWCWGDDTYGQLGAGDAAEPGDHPPPPVAVGESRSARGDDAAPPPPAAARDRRDVPVRVPGLGRVLEVVAGARHTCSLGHDGTVMCWGDDTFGQLARPGRPIGEPLDEHRGPRPLSPLATRTRPSPGPVAGLTDVVDLAVLEHHTCALRRGGGIVCWHAWADDPLTPERLVPGAVELAVGAAHTCVRLATGGVRCWGVNHTGRLGDGTVAERPGPVAVRGLDDAIALVAGRLHTCALRRDGDVVCWGDGFMGQLGDGSRADRPAPTPVPGLGRARALAAGQDTTCAIGQTGAVFCWGDGDAGQLGAIGPGGRFAPARVAAPPVRALAVGSRAVCTAGEDGVVACWGAGLSAPGPRSWDVVTTPRAIALN